MRSPEKISVRARTRIGIGFENASEDNFVLPSWQIFAADFVVTLRAAGEDNFVHAPTSFAMPNSYRELEKRSRRRYLAWRRSIASRASEQAVLAQKFPKRPAVFLHRECSASDVPMVRMQNRREKVMLKSLNRTGLHRSE